MTRSSDIAKRVDDEFGEHFRATDPSEAAPDNRLEWAEFHEPGQQKRMGEQYARKVAASGKTEPAERELPHDSAIETALLGSVVLDPSQIEGVRAIVGPDDFFSDPQGLDPARSILFSHVLAMHEAGLPPDDLALLTARLRQADDLERVGGMAYLAEVLNAVPHAGNAVFYAQEVKKLAIKRRMAMALERHSHHAANGAAPEDVLAQLTADIDKLGMVDASTKFATYSGPDLAAATFETHYHIEGLLVKGQPAILAGPQKSLKTSLGLDAAVAVAAGGFFLGKFPAEQGTVLVMTGESGMSTIKETLERICVAANRNLADLDALHVCDTIPSLADPKELNALRSLLKRIKPAITVFDPCYLMLPGDDAGNVFKMGTLLRSLTRVCQEAGTTPLLLHHARKGGLPDHEPLELQHIAWAGFGEYARQWLLVCPRERYEPGSGLHELWLSCGGSAGHGGLWGVNVNQGSGGHGSRRWEVELLSAEEVRRDREERKQDGKHDRMQTKLDAERKSLLRALAKFPEGETKETVRIHVGVSGAVMNRLVAAALDVGDIETCKVKKGRRKAGYDGIKLATKALTENV